MGKYFGTDGFRGEANKQLTVEHAFKWSLHRMVLRRSKGQILQGCHQ